jgi:hypothetical protein
MEERLDTGGIGLRIPPAFQTCGRRANDGRAGGRLHDDRHGVVAHGGVIARQIGGHDAGGGSDGSDVRQPQAQHLGAITERIDVGIAGAKTRIDDDAVPDF